MMNHVAVALQRNPRSKDVFYWGIFVFSWAFLWGLSDQEYLRNIFIQVCSLPARMLLVYVTIGYLYPRYFKTEKHITFFGLYIILLTGITLAIQRPLMIYFVQPHFLPFWNDPHFFGTSELINTALDINIAAIIPLGYTLMMAYKKRMDQLQASKQPDQANELTAVQFMEVRVEKAIKKIAIDEIIYIESQRNTVKIQLAAGELIVRETITSVEARLCDSNFKRIHRSFLVNPVKVTGISSNKVLCGNLIVPVGRKYKETVKSSLIPSN